LKGNIVVNFSDEELGSGTAAQPVAWLTDFGLSTMNELAGTFVPGTGYIAPELLLSKPEIRPRDELTQDEKKKDEEERKDRAKLLEKADVYAFGVTAYHVSIRSSVLIYSNEHL
jgi:serine/threonine protein kinase